MSDPHQDGRPPEPGQAVAAATTQTEEPQAHARHVRSTDWLAAGERHGLPEPGATMTPGDVPASEQEWFVRQGGPVPVHDLIVSEARAVEEALARLGPGASAADVQRDLERFGARVSLEDVNRIKACCDPNRGKLLLTEAEIVPPSSRAASGEGIPSAPRARANPGDLVRTEGESVPPPHGDRAVPRA